MEGVCHQLRKTALAHELVFEALPCAPLHEDELRIAPVLVGLCGSDHRILANHKQHRPGVFGHEVAARVVEVGGTVRDFDVGDLVTVNPVDAKDDENIIGYNGEGFLATRVTVRASVLNQRRVFRFARATQPQSAVFAEPLACCVHAQRRIAEDLPGARVVVIGSGSFGLLHYLLANEAGARAFVTARGRVRMQEAVKRGILPECDTSLDENSAHALIGTAHVVIVTANGIAAVEEGLRWAGANAKIVLFGGLADDDHLHGIPIGRVRREQGEHCTRIANKQLTFIGSYGTAREDFETSVAHIDAGNLQLPRLITHVVSLADAARVLASLGRGAIAGAPVLKLVVSPS